MLRDQAPASWLSAPFHTLFGGGEGRMVRVIAEPRFYQAQFIEVVAPDAELKAELVAAGYSFESQTDTEVIAVLIIARAATGRSPGTLLTGDDQALAGPHRRRRNRTPARGPGPSRPARPNRPSVGTDAHR